MHDRGNIDPVRRTQADVPTRNSVTGRAHQRNLRSTGMNTTLDLIAVWLLVASGVQLGTLWIMKLSILPMLNSLRYGNYVTICQLIDMHVFHPIAVWMGVISAGLGVWAAFLAPSAGAAALFIVGSVG